MIEAKVQTPPGFSWRRNLYIIWLAEFISMMGMGMSGPFMPFYIEQLGITGAAQVGVWSGLIAASSSVAMAIMSPVWGALADRHGRKLMLTRAMVMAALIIGAMGFVANVQQLLVLRLLQGALTGTVTACHILVAAGTPQMNLAFALGTLEVGVFLGQSIGPVIGGLIADTLGYRACFAITGIAYGIGGLMVILFVREVRASASEVKKQPSLRAGIRMLSASAIMLSLFAIRLLVRMASAAVVPTLPLFVQELVPNSDRAASLVGILASVLAVANALGAVLMGRIGDRMGVQRVLLASSAVMTVAYLGQAAAQDVTQLGIARAVAGLVTGGVLTNLVAAIAQNAPPGFQGAAFGLDTTFGAAANSLGPMAGSLMAVWWGNRAPFVFAGVLVGLSTVLLLLQKQQAPSDAKSPVA